MKDEIMWAGARRQCAQEGAALAVLTSRREAELLSRDFAFNASGAQHGHLAWLAASDAAQEGAWLTIAGLPLEETGYVKWHPSEPNGGNKENCLALTKADGFFIDANCAWKLSYICKMPM
ncbi:Hemolymph lipopolysaccharide-binding protein [Gryllus bimaculatus]|nr:Hemolymph lipopolysaccharide-binding protein [Gryllus bimaculatus]